MRIKIIFILLFILLFMLAGFVYGAIPAKERAALIALYESTNGDGWTNRDGWKGNHNESDGFSKIGSEDNWYGIKVTGNRVTFIDLDNNNLVGTIPVELGSLKNLKRLHLYNNKLTGKIPPELGDLSNLVGLSLVFNQLSGEIPAELGNLTNLKWLYLYYNQLTGSIPEDLRKLKNLEELYLNNNQLSEKIPPGLEKLSNLKILYLSSNQLTGDIPDKLGKLSNLEELYLHENLLTGDIPPELGDLSNLKKLYLNYNVLDGLIPPELGDLSKLEELCLNDNFLDGTIPPALGNLSYLKMLYLSRNQLSESIPPELGSLLNLEGLYLNDNQLSGPIPPELGNFSNLRMLNLSSNRLTGHIPARLCDLNNLLMLRLNSNRLQGDIPVTIKSLDGLLNESSDFRWNLLSTGDELVAKFLNSKQWGGKWQNTQTLTVANVSAQAVSANSIEVSWTPILYSGDPGGYDVFYSMNPGDIEAPFSSTTSKSKSSLEVTALTPGTTYFFAVQTRTDPHSNNNNIVLSDKSTEVSAATMDAKKTISGKVTDAAGTGIEDVTLTFFSSNSLAETEKTKTDGTYEHQVNPEWSGTLTPTKGTLFFSPRRLDFSNVLTDKHGQDFQLSLTLTLSASWEEDKAALIKINYGKIKINYIRIDTEGLATMQLTIYRKISGDNNYQAIKSFPNPAANIGELTYDDKYLDKNKTYTYIARAIDNNGNTVGESNEITIAANN